MQPFAATQPEAMPAVAHARPAVAIAISERLRRRRKDLGLTLREVAESAGLSVGFISQIERGIAMPSLSSLVSVARVLDVPVSDFLEPPNGTLPMTRHAERQRFMIGSGPISYERLSANIPGAQLRSVLIHQPPNHRGELIAHDGEELFYILDGTLTVEIEGARTVLNSGDSLHFRSSQRHLYWNNSNRSVTILHVCTMDLFGDQPESGGSADLGLRRKNDRAKHLPEQKNPTKGDS